MPVAAGYLAACSGETVLMGRWAPRTGQCRDRLWVNLFQTLGVISKRFQYSAARHRMKFPTANAVERSLSLNLQDSDEILPARRVWHATRIRIMAIPKH